VDHDNVINSGVARMSNRAPGDMSDTGSLFFIYTNIIGEKSEPVLTSLRMIRCYMEGGRGKERVLVTLGNNTTETNQSGRV
jgi:hypothetical protein